MLVRRFSLLGSYREAQLFIRSSSELSPSESASGKERASLGDFSRALDEKLGGLAQAESQSGEKGATSISNRAERMSRIAMGLETERLSPAPPLVAPAAERAVTASVAGDPEDLGGGDLPVLRVVQVRRVPSSSAGLRPASASTVKIEAVRSLVDKAGERHGVDPALGMAVARVESSFNTQATSTDGHATKGLFQLLDSTGRERLAEIDPRARYEPYDPDLNVELGMSHLRYLKELFLAPSKLKNGSATVPAEDKESLERFMVAAFNAGEGRVAQAQREAFLAGKDPSTFTDVLAYLPSSTQRYVEKVFSAKKSFSSKPLSEQG